MLVYTRSIVAVPEIRWDGMVLLRNRVLPSAQLEQTYIYEAVYIIRMIVCMYSYYYYFVLEHK